MDFREEGRIGSGIFMIGTALATLTSMTAVGARSEIRLVVVAGMGLLILAMVGFAGAVMTEGRVRFSTGGIGAGLAAATVGYLSVGHPFLYAFPGMYALAALVSVAFAKPPSTGSAGAGGHPGGKDLRGAGALPYREGFVLMQQRSETEEAPLTWCVFGGMREGAETPYETMVREVGEEAGLDVSGLPADLIETFEDPADGFRFETFLVRMPGLAVPVHSAETRASGWFPLGRTAETLWGSLPAPLHPGVARMCGKPEVVDRILAIVRADLDAAQADEPGAPGP